MGNSNRPTRLTAAALAAALAVMTVAGLAAAAPQPESVTIDSTMYVAGPPPNSGTFEVSGTNLLCANGDVHDTSYVWGQSHGAGGNPNGVPLQVDKTFVCPDGQVFIRLQIRGVYVSEVFTWVVLGGTGAYAGLHGEGKGWTDYSPFQVNGTVVNHYMGFLVHSAQ